MDIKKHQSKWWQGNCYHIEQLTEIINDTDVKYYSYILHDKDINPDTGELKKPHYHFLLNFYSNQRTSWFNKYNSDEYGQVFLKTVSSPQGAYDYQLHDTPTARKQGKYLYPETERISTIEQLEPAEKELDENAELYADLMELLDGKISWHEMLKRKPKRIHMISNIKTAYDILRNERYGIGAIEKLGGIEIPLETKKGKELQKAIQQEMDLGLKRVDADKLPF